MGDNLVCQNIFTGDTLHEISRPIFLEKNFIKHWSSAESALRVVTVKHISHKDFATILGRLFMFEPYYTNTKISLRYLSM